MLHLDLKIALAAGLPLVIVGILLAVTGVSVLWAVACILFGLGCVLAMGERLILKILSALCLAAAFVFVGVGLSPFIKLK